VSGDPTGDGSKSKDASLEGVAAAADEVADEQRHVAHQARSMQRRRDRGVPWARILDEEPSPTLLARLRRSGRRLTEAAGRASRTLVGGLMLEGESRRQIARRLGVSHQRVSAILNHGRRSSRPDTPDT
jgi:DNA invertase Pin-like site-specific DNA recombinase